MSAVARRKASSSPTSAVRTMNDSRQRCSHSRSTTKAMAARAMAVGVSAIHVTRNVTWLSQGVRCAASQRSTCRSASTKGLLSNTLVSNRPTASTIAAMSRPPTMSRSAVGPARSGTASRCDGLAVATSDTSVLGFEEAVHPEGHEPHSDRCQDHCSVISVPQRLQRRIETACLAGLEADRGNDDEHSDNGEDKPACHVADDAEDSHQLAHARAERPGGEVLHEAPA